jgi:hypothetical protein
MPPTLAVDYMLIATVHSEREPRCSTLPEVRLFCSMEGPVEEREPVADERRLDWIVENRSDRLSRAFALEEEDDLGLRQVDGVPVQGQLELGGAESRGPGEKLLRSLTTAGFQAGDED